MNVKPMTREQLSQKIEAVKERLGGDVIFVTSIRPTANNSISIEVCQNRVLEGSSITALGLLNQSDERFGTTGTLLFDWIKATPKDLVKVFPELKLTVEDLEAIAKTWDETAPTGKDAKVFPVMTQITKMVGNNVTYTPIIVVTEATETQIENGEFFTDASKNQKQNIAGALDEEYRVMKTSSEPDADYIVEPHTGDRIFRYTQLLVKEQNPQDRLIPGKITLTRFKARQAQASKTKSLKPEAILEGGQVVS